MFETAIEVFNDPNCVLEQDREVDGEARWQTLGRVEGVLLLIVAHTIDDEEGAEIVRIFSARKVSSTRQKMKIDIQDGDKS